MIDSPQTVLDEWFGPLDAEGKSSPEKVQRWFQGGAEFDAHLERRYGALIEQAVAGGFADWESTAEGAVALVLVLDQFTRNVYRKTPRMVAGDERALAVALRLIDDRERFERLPFTYRTFVCMPLMHAETLPMQERCIAEFQRLLDTAPPAMNEGYRQSLDYARRHRDIIARFGRFPHRNAILGRNSTAEEVEFLKTPGSSF